MIYLYRSLIALLFAFISAVLSIGFDYDSFVESDAFRRINQLIFLDDEFSQLYLYDPFFWIIQFYDYLIGIVDLYDYVVISFFVTFICFYLIFTSLDISKYTRNPIIYGIPIILLSLAYTFNTLSSVISTILISYSFLKYLKRKYIVALLHVLFSLLFHKIGLFIGLILFFNRGVIGIILNIFISLYVYIYFLPESLFDGVYKSNVAIVWWPLLFFCYHIVLIYIRESFVYKRYEIFLFLFIPIGLFYSFELYLRLLYCFVLSSLILFVNSTHKKV